MNDPLEALRNEVLVLREYIADLARKNAKEMMDLRDELISLERRINEAIGRAGAEGTAPPTGGPQSQETLPAQPPPLPPKALGEAPTSPAEGLEAGAVPEVAPGRPAEVPEGAVPPEDLYEAFSGEDPEAVFSAAAAVEFSGEPGGASGGAAAPVSAAPTPASREKEPETPLELRLGRVWFVRAGIALLLTGLVFLGNYAYKNWIHDLPAGARLAILYFFSGVLGGTGAFLARKENLRRFGEVVLAGGLAFFYWCSFAAHHVERLRVIESPVAGAVLLLASAGVMIGVSVARKAQATAVLGLLLASYATVLQPIGWLSFVSNAILAATGVALMLRPKWVGPGVAAMVGSYGAFLWWQMLGAASGRGPDAAALWFLPATWVFFVAPGMLERFGSDMSPRARAWFTGANNGALFGLFSMVWLSVHQGNWENYWMVPAVFGVVFAGLGIVGRLSGRTIIGGVYLSGGLGCLMFATVLKLDGYQLALSLAGESIALAFSFLRYRGRIELVFCVVAVFGAMAGSFAPIGIGPLSGLTAADIPAWSTGLVALMLTAAAVVLRHASDGADEEIRELVRVLGTAVLGGAAVVGIGAWLLRLPETARFPIGMGTGLALAGLSLLADRRRWLPELGWISGAFAIASLPSLLQAHPAAEWPVLAGIGFALAACWLWHHRVPAPATDGYPGPLPDPAATPNVSAWLYAAIVPAAVLVLWRQMHIRAEFLPVVAGLCALAGVSLGVVLRCHRLSVTTVFLHFVGLIATLAAITPGTHTVSCLFCGFETPMLALATLGLFFAPVVQERLPKPSGLIIGISSRLVVFLGWWFAWMLFSPEHWVEALSGSAVAIAAATRLRKPKSEPLPGITPISSRSGLPAEAWGYLVISAICFGFVLIGESWSDHLTDAEITWRYWLVAPAFLACAVFVRRAGKAPVAGFLFLVTSIVFALWSTHWLVWMHGWKPICGLWAFLGFAYVSAGLWQRLAVVRATGFVLLIGTLLKLFFIDVWDFAAFTRIASFLALGLALVLLGFFYNRFAEVLKKLFEDNTDQGPKSPN